ncbi:MAG: lamin tail domain-containing protein [Prolixibacteraceae bacterium]|nr:lamin tail domain-containing protein [Prolixibacteraceae bacterium]
MNKIILSLLSVILFLYVNVSTAQTDLQIPSTDTPPLIDGIMDDVWGTGNGYNLENYLAGSAVSSTDFSAYFKTLWDADNLYVLVDVTDDVKIYDSGEVWQDDAVEVYIDINNDKQTSYGADDVQYSFRWNDFSVYSNNGRTDGVQFSISGSTNGYLLEVSFPWETLGLNVPKAGDMLGFDVHVHDDDDGGERDTKKGWFTSEDQSWNNPSLFATAMLTGEFTVLYRTEKPKISVARGFYSSPFDATISSVIEGMDIYYTLDGSDPSTSSTAIVAKPPVVVHIDPASIENRGSTPAVVLRACAYKEGYDFSFPATRTYIFVDEVRNQTEYPGHLWPKGNYVNDQEIDLLIDPRVVDDPQYTDQFEDALLEIPSISLSTDYESLFDPSTGIYVNAMDAHGEEWERPASIELINPDGSKGFQIDAGIRIRGGWSRHGYFRKHAFRFFFRNEYGEGKLDFPLFEDEGVKEFDKVDLRCSQNYSWSKGDWEETPYCTFNRDVFSRDVQREMGQPYTRSRYYHLYINGLYWGLFQTQERSEARYAESYFGGDSDDYDVVKRGDSGIEATDGNLNAWQEIWDILQNGFTNNTNYYKLQGLALNGKRDPSLKVLVDIDNLIDYMNIIFYTGNFDAPTSAFGNNKSVNNFYTIYNRNDPNEGFKFFAHDNEHTLQIDPVGPGHGITEDRVSIGSWTNNYRMEVGGFYNFHPQWLHFKLSDNAEYRQRFADRSYKYYYNNGILTPGRTAALFTNRTLEYDTAVIAESARWGDTNGWKVYTKNDDWIPIIQRTLNEYFPYRTDIVIEQLKNEGLLSSVDMPEYRSNNIIINEEIVEASAGYNLQVRNNNASGTIRYTVDGSDPRLVGGDISSNAINGGNQVTIELLQTTIVKARIYNNGYWSSIRTLNVVIDQEIDGIQITEIHYNPLDENGKSGSDYEFLELKNTASEARNLTAATFIDGINFTFESETILNPGEFIVLASTAFSFNQRYGFQPYGEYEGQLNNGGERITLVLPTGDTIVTVSYNDKGEWPSSPDGLGFSLVPASNDPDTDWDDGSNWRASATIHGSPGADDASSSILEIIINEILSNSTQPDVDVIELFNPNNTQVNIGGWFLSDDRDEPTKWVIPQGTIIPANGYLTFYEGHYSGNTLLYSDNEFGSAFSLSSHGETAYIFSGDGVNLTGFEYAEDFGEIEEGVSFGRHITSTGDDHFVAQAQTSFNSENGYPRVGPVVISKIMYNPEPDNFEYLEIVNTGTSPVDLFNAESLVPWKIEGINFDFPAGTTLEPGELVYVVESAIGPDDYRFFKNLDNDVKIFNFAGKLKNEGEELTLRKAAPQYLENNIVKSPYIRIDRVDYNDKSPWPDADGNGNVLCRIGNDLYGNDPASWYAAPPGISINNGALTIGIVQIPYNMHLFASGGTPPFTWSIASGNLPQGISLDPITGVLSGIPPLTGTSTFVIQVDDQLENTTEKQFSLTIKENTLPLAVNDENSTTTGINVTTNVIDNDIDQDGDKSSWLVTIVNGPSNGSAVVNNDNTITYTPDLGFSGSDRLTYRVTDAIGYSEASLDIEVEQEILSGEIDIRIVQTTDDAEENIYSNQFWDASTDLELAIDATVGGDQIIGLRFQNIGIPAGAEITNAWVQFQTDEVSGGDVSLLVFGEASDNPVTFSNANLISARPRTTAQVAWAPGAWNFEGENSETQRTPDLSEVVAEIVNREGWQEGNAIVIMVTGTGTRTAESFDGDAAGAPLLHVEYSKQPGEAAIPVAVIGESIEAGIGEVVFLNGSQSYSPDGRALNYHWELKNVPEGSSAVISNPNIVNPTITTDQFGTYVIEFWVDNGINQSEKLSRTVTVLNHQPVANAGKDQARVVGALIRLNGSGSNDADGDPLVFSWSMTEKPGGSVAGLSNTAIVNPTFIADVEGIYRVSLITYDGYEYSEPDEVMITVSANQPPVADAGDDRSVIAGSNVELNGEGSSDPEGVSLSFSWLLVSSPSGSMATLSKADNDKPLLHTDLGGEYVVELTVSDGTNSSAPDQVIVTAVQNSEPLANAGENQTVNAGEPVSLNGSLSTDPDGSVITYYWSFVTRPAGSHASISGIATAYPTFTPDRSGLYTIRLQVSDGTFAVTDDVQVTALKTNAAPNFVLKRTLSVYPNPFDGVLTVDYFTTEEQTVNFSLYNISGTKIKTIEILSKGHTREQIDFNGSGLQNGLYMLVATPEQGDPALVKLNFVMK